MKKFNGILNIKKTKISGLVQLTTVLLLNKTYVGVLEIYTKQQRTSKPPIEDSVPNKYPHACCLSSNSKQLARPRRVNGP